ncbi:MAG: PDZ domain-containing protein [Acidobacteriaceae bacterium]|jgi:C-terminal processing protease CtpA/Prc
MKSAFGYGLILLAASAFSTQSALAWGNGGSEVEAGGVQFLMSGPGTVRGAQGYLGVDVRDVPADQVAVLKLKEARGAEIILVDHDAPAGKAGLREHDVVLQMNGQAIDGEDQLRKLLHECSPGKAITLVISRDGQQVTVTTQMANREEVERQAWEQHLTVPEPQGPPSDITGSDFGAAASTAPAVSGNSFVGTMLMNPSYTGAMLEEMSSQLADYFGVSSGVGLLVRSVQSNSPAAVAGMRAGDVVMQADAKPMANTGDWAKAIKNSQGHAMTIVVMRDKKQQTLTLTPDSKKRSNVQTPAQDRDAAVGHLGLSFRPQS